MKKHEWTFPVTADKLAEAAKSKHDHHIAREEWWSKKKAEVMAKIREEGLEVDESLVAEDYGAKFSTANYGRGPQVSVRNDLLRDLTECVTKIREHYNKAREYSGWHEVLSSQGQRALDLHHDDWLFFFSKH